MNSLRNLPLACLIIFIMQGCKEESYSEKNGPNHISKGQTYDLKLDETLLKVELAATPKDRERGLMFRKSIGPKEGMLFVFKNGTKQRFWMKNTRIPLDIGYFSSNGSLREIHKAKPYDLSGVPSISRDIKFVLELNAGAYKKLGIRIGSRLDLKTIAQILIRKGLNPQDFNLSE